MTHENLNVLDNVILRATFLLKISKMIFYFITWTYNTCTYLQFEIKNYVGKSYVHGYLCGEDHQFNSGISIRFSDLINSLALCSGGTKIEAQHSNSIALKHWLAKLKDSFRRASLDNNPRVEIHPISSIQPLGCFPSLLSPRLRSLPS